MPVIATSDRELHIKLKVFVAQNPELTIGRAIEEFTRFCLDSGLSEMPDEKRREVIEFIKKLNG